MSHMVRFSAEVMVHDPEALYYAALISVRKVHTLPWREENKMLGLPNSPNIKGCLEVILQAALSDSEGVTIETHGVELEPA